MTWSEPTMAEDVLVRVEQIAGQVALGNYLSAPESERPGLVDFLDELRAMTDAQFLAAAESAIMEDAILQRFRGNHSSTYFRSDACCEEGNRRLLAAGHERWCPSSLYNKAHANAMRSQRYKGGPTACTCAQSGR